MVKMVVVRFWLLDINYDMVGDVPEVRMWGLDDQGRRVVVLDRSFRPYFYVLPEPGRETETLDALKRICHKYKIIDLKLTDRKFFGRPVKVIKVTCQVPRLVPEIREAASRLSGVRDVLEADIRFYMRYMIDNDIYPCSWHEVEAEEIRNAHGWRVDKVYLAKSRPRVVEGTPPPLRVYAFDIECYNPLGEPNPVRDPVILISVKRSDGVAKVFTASDKDDREIIRKFVEDIKSFDPDVIIGYNSNRFDWPYLLERCKRVGVRLDVSRAGGQPAQSVYGHFSIVGRANVDLFDFAQEVYEVKVKTLENIADYLGVMPKNEREIIEGAFIYKYWDDEKLRPKLIKYARDDAESTYGVGEKFLPFAMQLASIVGLPLDQVGSASVGYRVEWHLMRQAFKLGELIPNRVERPYETYKGAIVLKPRPGIHRNIAVLDFTSMYPNIMISKNISPDTYVPPNEDVDEDQVYVTPEVGHRFRKSPPGFYRRVLERLLEARAEIRKRMKGLDPESSEYRVLDERQRAIKVIANATYGYCGWLGARWYKREVAEATTAWGRMIITKTIRFARELGLRVIYGDTDSIFVNYDREKVERLINEVNSKLNLEIKVDKVYVKVFFTEAKKRYCGLLKDGRIDVVGLEAVRGDWTELAKEVQERVIEIVLREESPSKAVDYVRGVIKNLENHKIPLHKLIIWKTLSKRIEDYEVETAHVAVAKQLAALGYQVSKGEKIGMIVCRGGERLADRVRPYILVKDYSEIDIDYYIKKQIIPAALRILGYFGVREEQFLSGEKQASILDFF